MRGNARYGAAFGELEAEGETSTTPVDGAPSSSSSTETPVPTAVAAVADSSGKEEEATAAALEGEVKEGGEGEGKEEEEEEEEEEKKTCKGVLTEEWEALRDGLGKFLYVQYGQEDGDGHGHGHAPADAAAAGLVVQGSTDVAVDGEDAANDGDDDGDDDDDDDDDDEAFIEQLYGIYHAICAEVYGLVDSGGFQKSIAATIILAAFLAGVSTYFEEDPVWVIILGYIVSWIFVLEMVLKIIGEQPYHCRYFVDPWNLFDFFIVMASFSPDGGALDFVYNNAGFVSEDATFSKNVKLLRILRLFKLVRNIKGLQMIIVSLVKALEFGKYIALLTVMSMYLFAVLGMIMFAENDPVMFGTLHAAMITLWQALSGDDWTEIMYTQSYGCDDSNADGHYGVGGNDGHGDGRCVTPGKTNYAVVTFFFLLYVVVLSMMMLNLFVGAVLMAVEETRQEMGDEENLHVHIISGHDIEIADWSLIGEGRSDPYCLIEVMPEWPPASHDHAVCLGHFGTGAELGAKLFGEQCTAKKCGKRCGESCVTKRMWVPAGKNFSSCCTMRPSKDTYRNTKVQKQTLQPVWDEHYDFFPLDNMGSHMLHIQCWDWDMCGGDDPLGDLNIDLSTSSFLSFSLVATRCAAACLLMPPFTSHPTQASLITAPRTSFASRSSTPQRATSSSRFGKTVAARQVARGGIPSPTMSTK